MIVQFGHESILLMLAPDGGHKYHLLTRSRECPVVTSFTETHFRILEMVSAVNLYTKRKMSQIPLKAVC